MQVAYLVNQYPGISHTFIRREIQALERAGVSVVRFAVRPSKQPVIAEEDFAEAARTRYILTAHKLSLLFAIARSLAGRPARSLKALAAAVSMSRQAENGVFRHFIYWAEAAALAEWLRQGRHSHLHAHFGTNSATVARLAAQIAGIQYSFTVHGPEEFDKSSEISLSAKIKAAKFVCAISSYGASQLRRLVPPNYWSKIRIIRCGVEKVECAASLQPLPRAPRFVSVGRLCEQKGQMTLVEAAARLKRDGREFVITLVGDGEMRSALERAAAHHDVGDRIVFAGWKTPAEVQAEIEGSRVFLLPSYAEGLPVSIMEAFCLQRPVISTYVAGIPELVIPGENGWLAPAGDDVALAAAMAAALDAPDEQLQSMGQAGQARVRRDHDIGRSADELKALFYAAADTEGSSS